MTEEKVKEIVKAFLSGEKLKDMGERLGVTGVQINTIIARLRKAGANIPRRVKMSSGIDFNKLAAEINAGN